MEVAMMLIDFVVDGREKQVRLGIVMKRFFQFK